MEHEGYGFNFWAFSFHKLAGYCHEVAVDPSPELDPALRAESKLLHTEWVEYLALPEEDAEQTSRRAQLLGSLRKRTIEILVRTGKWE